MTGTKNVAWKGYLITFGLTIVATIIGGVILGMINTKQEQNALAQKTAVKEQQPRKVTVTTPEEELTT